MGSAMNQESGFTTGQALDLIDEEATRRARRRRIVIVSVLAAIAIIGAFSTLR